MKLCVQNIPFAATEEQIRQLFEQYGPVSKVSLIYDKADNRPKGFGFVEMDDANQASEAMNDLTGNDFMGRPLRIEEAREREPRRSFDSHPRNGNRR